jgi:hypothetical protein
MTVETLSIDSVRLLSALVKKYGCFSVPIGSVNGDANIEIAEEDGQIHVRLKSVSKQAVWQD